MKNLFYITLFLLSIASCKLEEDSVGLGELEPRCGSIEAIFSPSGYLINHIGDFPNSTYQLQFIDNFEGYAWVAGGLTGHLIKTTDGGSEWKYIDFGIEARLSGFAFKNKNFGIATFTGNRYAITTNGGKTWDVKYPNDLSGDLERPQFDEFGNIYAFEGNRIVVSYDNAVSWEEFYDTTLLGTYSSSFIFELAENKIFIAGQSGNIIVISKSGEYLYTIEIDKIPSKNNFVAIDDDNLVVTSIDNTIKSTDGGITWDTIYDKTASMIGFETSQKGILIINKEDFSTDTPRRYDLVAVTENGGIDWNEADETQLNLGLLFRAGQYMGNGRYVFIREQCLFEIYPN